MGEKDGDHNPLQVWDVQRKEFRGDFKGDEKYS